MGSSIPTFSFDQACAYLFPRLGHGERWSLEPTQALLAALGDPERQFPIVHIGGTNGKGSVSVLVSEALRATGFRVGLYTSPHLVDVTERIVVDGTPISRDAFANWTSILYPDIERTGASFFEAGTALALAHFAASLVDVGVVEVGLGGRLDSTNVVRPVVSAVTTIGWDHREYLGDTLEAIALEKAEIAKPDVPFVVGEADPLLRDLLENRARVLGARPIHLPSDVTYDGALCLSGGHQRRNAAVAELILEQLPADLSVPAWAVEHGFRTAWLPGRYERRGRWILDVAHNEGGVTALAAAIRAEAPPGPVHVLLGVLRDKPLRRIVEILAGVADRLWLTLPPSAPSHRALTEDDIRDLPPTVRFDPDFDRCLVAFQAGGETLLVTGSFYTVGDVMTRLPGFQPFG